MRRALLWILALSLGLGAPAAQAQTSQFKGWIAVSRELSTRLAPPGVSLDLYQFIPADDLDDLLGTWYRFGDEHTFQNGAPNSVSMVIWRIVLSGLAKSLADSCVSPRYPFNQRFASTLQALCTWPAPAAKTDAVMLDFWLSVMGYDAPQTEFTAWRDFVRQSYGDRPAAETIEAMTLAISMNPYFLLHR
jgi:hypothetical protein